MFQKILKFIANHFLYILLAVLIFIPTLILGEKSNLVRHLKLIQLKLLDR